jgi:DNA-binding response OmpR family regulator
VSESLARRLLRLSSGGLPLILFGRDLSQHLGPELDRALSRRVLIELPQLDEWPPCARCENGCEARPIRELNGRPVAMCPYDSSSDEALSEDDLRLFELDVEELCLAIREDSRLTGDGPQEIVEGIWLIGRTDGQGLPSRCIILAFNADLDAAVVIAMLRRVAGARSVSLLLAGDCDLTLRLALEDAGVVPLPILELLAVDDESALFCLDTGSLISSRPRPRLVLQRSNRSVTFQESSKVLSPQSFKLLLFMMTRTQAGHPLISNASIEDELWGTTIHSRQVGDVVRRLREALSPILGGLEQAKRLIQNHPNSYSIDQEFAVIEII